MKNKVICLSLVITVLLVILNCIKNDNNLVLYEKKSTSKKSLLSMNIEQTAGAGDYKQVTQSNWPTDGYKFNNVLSRCENGSTLSWDDINKTVVFSGDVSDKCYVYFDIIPSIADYCTNGTDLAACVKNFGNQGADISNIYIHNSSLENGAGDNSYRYAGPSDNVNNYVCISNVASTCPEDDLYRIIGVFENQVKVIKANSVTSAQRWNSPASAGNTWSSSSLNTYLNGTYLANLGIFADKIATTTWKVGGSSWSDICLVTPSVAYQNEIANLTNNTDSTKEYTAKIGLMYVSDYEFAASPRAWTLLGYNTDETKDYRAAISINWLYSNRFEWTISSSVDSPQYAFAVKGTFGNNVISNPYVVRPSFYFESIVTYKSGSGTQSDPILIN